MPEVHVYEPALCCNTGVCGPELDQRLVAFTADLAHVNAAGGQVQRHNLANDAQAFVANDAVRAFLHLAGSEGLPLTVVGGVTVLTGAYPTREQLARYAGLAQPDLPDQPAQSDPPDQPAQSDPPDQPAQSVPVAPRLLPLTAADVDAGSCSADSATGCC